MKPGGGGMGQDKRMDMGPMGDYNGMMGKGHGPRHQLHKDPPIDRGPYYDKVGPGRGRCAVGCSEAGTTRRRHR